MLRSIYKTSKNPEMKTAGILLVMIALFAACDDVFEEDLADDLLVIIAPQDSFTTTNVNTNFLWEAVDGAIEYRFQIAQPSFNNLQQLIVDSTVTESNITYVLTPGSYEWRIRAENGSSVSAYITRYIQIDSTPDLSGQQIILIDPTSGLATNQTTHTFKWYSIYNADQYSFLIKTPDFSGTAYIPEIITADDSLELIDIPEGQYEWGIRGENQFSNTIYTTRTIWIDTTAPALPVLSFPANNATMPDSTFALQWTNTTDNGTSITDSLYIYTDTLMTNLIQTSYTTNESFTDSLGIGTYFWRVRSIDAATNNSAYTNLWKFTVQ
jgi:predicted secreted protein